VRLLSYHGFLLGYFYFKKWLSHESCAGVVAFFQTVFSVVLVSEISRVFEEILKIKTEFRRGFKSRRGAFLYVPVRYF